MQIKFEPRDCWIGLFWNTVYENKDGTIYYYRRFYICILPCFPIIFEKFLGRTFRSQYLDP